MKNIEWRHVTWYSQLFAIMLFLDVFGLGLWLGLQFEAARVQLQLDNVQALATQRHDAMEIQQMNHVIATASYKCSDGKTIQAEYLTNSVNLSLSDGRNMNLLQSVSADGGRYTNSDESVVFWSKGTGAFLTEGTKTTYDNCTQVKS